SLRIFSNVVRQELQGDKAMQLYVLSFVDNTHAATAKLLDDAVMRNGVADHSWRILRGRNRQVNQSGGVGGISRGLLAKNRVNTHCGVLSEVAAGENSERYSRTGSLARAQPEASMTAGSLGYRIPECPPAGRSILRKCERRSPRLARSVGIRSHRRKCFASIRLKCAARSAEPLLPQAQRPESRN